MKLLKFKHIIVILFLLCLVFHHTTSYAADEDPGAGRLSGNHISSDFYSTDNSTILNHYGSTKEKSPYTNTTYTHQTIFDERTVLQGIDISKWQGEIDWTKVKADGIDYAFIQVGFRGYGSSGILDETTKDPYFDVNMQNAIAAGVKVGVYIFSQAITSEEAIEEADYILNAIGDYAISMPLVMDYEYASTSNGLGGRLYNAKLSKAEATDICMAFCKEIADAGFTPMVYANKSMLENQLTASTLTNAGYRIWLANYAQKTTYDGSFDFWQYSEKGKVDGIYGNVDMNFYYAQETDNFVLNPNSIFNADISEVPDQIYTGTAYVPEIIVTHNNVVLTPNVDYTISYENNQDVGTATITVTGIGNYTNVKRIRFAILPQPMEAVKAKTRSTSYIKLSWKQADNMNGYEIYRSPSLNGTYKIIQTISKNTTVSYKDTKLSEGQCYYYKIRSYKVVGSKTYYSEFSPTATIYTKTGYTRNAITKSKTTIYDCISDTAEAIPITNVTKNNTLSVIYSTQNQDGKTWYYVSYKKDSITYKGFVASSKVTITKLGKVVKTKQVNVRKSYSAYSKKLTTLKRNTKVNVLSTKKQLGVTWYKVTFKKNNKTYTGWISAPYIEII